MAASAETTERIVAHARALGFQRAAVVAADDGRLAPDKEFLKRWLGRGYAADMDWLTRRAGERVDPAQVLAGCKSVLCLSMRHLPRKEILERPRFAGKVARYAWGRDYHQLINKRLRKLRRRIEAELPGVRTYLNVDTGPVLERSYAEKAGLGWIGHNTCLIDPEDGSYLFLAEVLLDRELVPTGPVHRRMPDCGTCTACLDACPTEAFVGKGLLDSRKCISYLTIENSGEIPDALREKVGTWVFGCDICQEVCPWNKEAGCTEEADFEARPGHAPLDLEWVLGASDEEIEEKFLGSPLRRAKGRGLKRNALVALGNLGDPKALPLVEKFRDSGDELLREHARWALRRLGGSTRED